MRIWRDGRLIFSGKCTKLMGFRGEIRSEQDRKCFHGAFQSPDWLLEGLATKQMAYGQVEFSWVKNSAMAVVSNKNHRSMETAGFAQLEPANFSQCKRHVKMPCQNWGGKSKGLLSTPIRCLRLLRPLLYSSRGLSRLLLLWNKNVELGIQVYNICFNKYTYSRS